MACCCNYCLSLINSFLLILSLPFLVAGWAIKSLSDSPCIPLIYKPLFVVGVFLLVLSLIGMLGSCCRLRCFLWIYLTLVFLLILIVAFILLFGAANIKGESSSSSKRASDLSLENYSSWLRNKMVDEASWGDIMACMKEHHVCGKFEIVRHLVDMINLQRSKLSSIEVSCCKPPSYCGFIYMDEDIWEAPKSGFNSSNVDCTLWGNDKDHLCYNCNSCKVGYLADFMNYWRKLTVVNMVLLSFLILVFLIGCCALL